MLIKPLYIVIILFVLSSCQKEKKENKIINIELKSNLTNNFSDKLKIDKVYCLKKENRDFFISSISKVVFTDKYLFVLDRHVTQNVSIFDKKGNYIKNLGFVRDGGQESYSKLKDLFINNNEIVLVADSKLMFFNLKTLTFVKSKIITTPIINLVKLKDKFIGLTFEKNILAVFNKDYIKQNSFMKLIPIFSIKSSESFSKDTKNLYFHRYLENNLYKVTENGIDTISFKFKGFNNYEKLDLNKKIFNPIEAKRYLIDEILTAEIYVIDDFFVLLSRDVDPYYYFYDRNNPNNSFSIFDDEKNWNNKKNLLTKDHSSPNIIGSTKTHLIAIIESEYLDNNEKASFCGQDEFDMAITLLSIKK